MTHYVLLYVFLFTLYSFNEHLEFFDINVSIIIGRWRTRRTASSLSLRRVLPFKFFDIVTVSLS